MKCAHDLGEDLAQYPDELVVDQRAAFEGWFLQTFNLLLDDGVECAGTDEQ